MSDSTTMVSLPLHEFEKMRKDLNDSIKQLSEENQKLRDSYHYVRSWTGSTSIEYFSKDEDIIAEFKKEFDKLDEVRNEEYKQYQESRAEFIEKKEQDNLLIRDLRRQLAMESDSYAKIKGRLNAINKLIND